MGGGLVDFQKSKFEGKCVVIRGSDNKRGFMMGVMGG